MTFVHTGTNNRNSPKAYLSICVVFIAGFCHTNNKMWY